ncbi:DPP IV N-terminal domain-containing protein [Shewanella sp. YIC-542]|uniref:S9 family peptidase n=1 Tax=Shewanella mytili TaxID=3377111 RepID=UPI00398EA87C
MTLSMAFGSTAAAQTLTGGTEPLIVERLHASPDLAGSSPRQLTLSPDGRLATFLVGRKDDLHFYDLWQMDVASGEVSLLLDASKLSQGALSDEEKARRERQRIFGQGIMEYVWADDGKALLIPSAGKLYYYTLADGKARLLPTGDGFATDAKLSPKGHYVTFVAGQNLWLLGLADNQLTQLTTDGGGVIKNAMAEFVAQEEMGRMTGYWWAPDESAIAFTRIDESPVTEVTRNEIYADGIKLIQQRYPAAGSDNVLIQLGVININNKQLRWIDLGDDRDFYLPRVNWLPDSRHLAFQWQSRNQQQLALRMADTHTKGAPALLLTERSNAWINLNDDLHFLKQGGFLWSSERSGFNHIYRFDANGKQLAQLTQGNWAVDSIRHVDESQGWVYFAGRKDSDIEKHLYKVRLDGSGLSRLSQRPGMHDATFADNAPVYLDYFNSLSQPPQVSLHDASGKRLRWVEENAVKPGHPLYPYAGLWQLPEFGTLGADDGQTLHYRLFKPANFNPAKRYPVLVRVYGGPHAQLVVNSWSSQDYFTQYLLQQGFAVFQLDNRGSGHRGTRFEQAIYRQLGVAEVADQQRGVAFLRSLPWVDGSKIAIYGHSYGGYMALMCKFKAPEDFALAISGAPVTDWALYDTHYTERYLAHPAENPQGYQQSSVLPYLGGYQQGLLMYHGMADDNVLFENSTRVYKALQDEGKLFEMVNYPGAKHSMRGNAVKTHLYRSLTDFLQRHFQRQ